MPWVGMSLICHSASGMVSHLVDCLCIKSADTDVEMPAICFQNFIAAHCYIYYGVQKIKPASLTSKQFLTVWGLKDAKHYQDCML